MSEAYLNYMEYHDTVNAAAKILYGEEAYFHPDLSDTSEEGRKEALLLLEKAEKIEPQNGISYIAQGYIHAANKDAKKSLEVVERGLKNLMSDDQRYAQFLNTIKGQALYALRDHAKAIPALNKGIGENNKHNAKLCLQIHNAYRQLNNDNLMMKVYVEEGLNYDPDNVKLNFLMAVLSYESGTPKSLQNAKTYYDRFFELATEENLDEVPQNHPSGLSTREIAEEHLAWIEDDLSNQYQLSADM